MIWLKMLGVVLVAYALRAAFRSSRAISLPTLDARLEPLTILPGERCPKIAKLSRVLALSLAESRR